MKKLTASIIILFAVSLVFVSCGKTGGPKAGTAKSDDMLSLLPADAEGVFFVDMERAMKSDFIQKAIAEEEEIQALIQKTGIDPAQDIYYLAGAFVQKSEQEEDKERGAVVVNMKYDKNTLLPLIREKAEEEGQEIAETVYEGFTLYSTWAEGKEAGFSFIDESNIVVGNPDQVQSVIDVVQKKKDNVFKNTALVDLISQTDRQALLWGAILFKPEMLDAVTSENPMLQDLQGIQSASLTFDIKDQTYLTQIVLAGGDEAKNKQIAEFLTGIKAFGAMMAGEKPEIGEILNSIDISSGPENVQINASIAEELLTKIQGDLKSKEDIEEEEIK